MKKTLTFCCLLFLSYTLHAQKVLFFEDFNGFSSYYISGWSHRVSGPVPWQAGEPYLVGECIGPLMQATGATVNVNRVAGIVDCSLLTDYDNGSDLMFTPPISLATDTGAWLIYDSYFGKITDGSHTERATIEVSTDTGHTWTVVQDVPANTSFSAFSHYYVSLSAFNHAPAIWIGFRYSDGGGHMRGWVVDNVKVIVPAQKDIALTSVTPLDSMLSYVTIKTGYKHQAQVTNMGNDPISAFLLLYRQQGAPAIYAQYVSGVNIPRFGTYDFTHNIPDTVWTAGRHKVDVWAALIDDSIHYNDSAHIVLNGAYFIPKKRLLIEDGTSTQNGYCPENLVLMNNTPADVEVCKVSVHFGDSDAMALSYYDDFLYYLHFPNNQYIYVDRNRIQPGILNSVLNYKKDYFGYADLILDPHIDGDSLTMNVTMTPAINMAGDFRLAMVITEDHVTGTDSTYAQRNFYSGGLRGVMGGYELKPNPVPAADMQYNFVARVINPSPGGTPGIIPATLTHNTNYDYTLGARISSSWQQNKLKAIVMLIRNDDSTVINSNQTVWYLGVPVHQQAAITASIYPNPANEYTNVLFTLARSQKLNVFITDIMGKILYQQQDNYNAGDNKLMLRVSGLAMGTYLVNLVGEDGKATMKLEIVR